MAVMWYLVLLPSLVFARIPQMNVPVVGAVKSNEACIASGPEP